MRYAPWFVLLLFGCDASVVVETKDVDAGAAEQPPDAAVCEFGNPGQLPCESDLDCPVVPIGECYVFVCPFNDAGASYCEGKVKP